MQNNISALSRFSNNLFGAIGAGAVIPFTGADFLPVDNKGNKIDVSGNNQARWLGLQTKTMQRFAYEFCYPLASVVDRLAEYDLTCDIEITRLNGKGKDNVLTSDWAKRVLNLLENPNPLQSYEQFRGQQLVYKRIFGYCPVLPLLPLGYSTDPSDAVAMINIPPWCFEPIVKHPNVYFGTKLEDYISGWRVNILGREAVLAPNDVFILKDGFFNDELEQFILPKSKLVGLDMAVSNLCAAMEADNVLLRKKGPLGFISDDPGTKDNVAGYLAMSKIQKKNLQSALTRYGLGWNQYQYVVSRRAARWNPMSYDVKQLGTKETVTASEKAICHRFAYPYVLYEEQDATYANAASALKSCFTNNVIPNNKKDYKEFAKHFKASENNGKIIGNFDKVAAFQEDEKFRGEAKYQMNQGLQIEWMNDVITLNQWRTAQGYDTTTDGDIYYSAWKKLNPELQNTQPINDQNNGN